MTYHDPNWKVITSTQILYDDCTCQQREGSGGYRKVDDRS